METSSQRIYPKILGKVPLLPSGFNVVVVGLVENTTNIVFPFISSSTTTTSELLSRAFRHRDGTSQAQQAGLGIRLSITTISKTNLSHQVNFAVRAKFLRTVSQRQLTKNGRSVLLTHPRKPPCLAEYTTYQNNGSTAAVLLPGASQPTLTCSSKQCRT